MNDVTVAELILPGVLIGLPVNQYTDADEDDEEEDAEELA